MNKSGRTKPGEGSLFVSRKLDGIATTETYPGAVTILTPKGNKITVTLTSENVERFAALVVECLDQEGR